MPTTQNMMVTRLSPRATRALEPAEAAPRLAIKLRLADGRLHEGTVFAERHRKLHLGLLHGDSDGYVEIAAGRRPAGGKLRIVTRRDAGHFLPGGATGDEEWMEPLLALVASHHDVGDEVCVGPAVRLSRAAVKAQVAHTNWLWIDVDGRAGLPLVRQLLRRKAPHLVLESAGSGGVHCYWRLRTPLQARTDATGPVGVADWPGWLTSGATTETIERAHERLIYALGYEWRNGSPTPTVADRACKDRSRVMRLAGTVNGKTGNYARIMWADFALPSWPLRALIGDLPDPPRPRMARGRVAAAVSHEDPYKRIAPAEYFQRLARIEVPQDGLVSCPNPAHDDATPSCHVGKDAGEGWYCHGCGAAGAIYDLASVLLGGPTGQWLRGEPFRRARKHVEQTIGAA
jgi:hypothetical protein